MGIEHCSFGDSAGDVVVVHECSSTRFAWISADLRTLHYYTLGTTVRDLHAVRQTTQVAHSQLLPWQANHDVMVFKASTSQILLIVSNESDSYGVCAITLDGQVLFQFRAPSYEVGQLDDMLWVLADNKTLHVLAISSRHYMCLECPSQLVPLLHRPLVAVWNPTALYLLLCPAGAASLEDVYRLAPAEELTICKVTDSGASIRTVTGVRTLKIIRDQLGPGFLPSSSAVVRIISTEGKSSKTKMLDVGGVVPVGFLLELGDNATYINETPITDGSTPDWLNRSVGGPHESFALARFSVQGTSLNDEEFAVELHTLHAGVDADENVAMTEVIEETTAQYTLTGDDHDEDTPPAPPMPLEWYTRLTKWGSAGTVSHLLGTLASLELYKTHVAEAPDSLDSFIDQCLMPLRAYYYKKLEPPSLILQTFVADIYQRLRNEHKLLYAYVFGRFDLLLLDGLWSINSVTSSPLNLTPAIDYNKEIAAFLNLVQSTAPSISWTNVIRLLNNTIAHKLMRVPARVGQNIKYTTCLQVNWNSLNDIDRFLFPWGRHGPSNRIDLITDYICGFNNALSQINAEDLLYLMKLRIMPEIASLTKLFSFSFDVNPQVYDKLIDQALKSEIGVGDVVTGCLWSKLRRAHYLSGAILGYGLQQCRDQLEDLLVDELPKLLDDLTRFSSRKYMSLLSSVTMTENGLSILDHTLDHSDEPDWYHDNIENKKSPVINSLLYSTVLAVALTGMNSLQDFITIICNGNLLTDSTNDESLCRHNGMSRLQSFRGLRSRGFDLIHLHRQYDLNTLDSMMFFATTLHSQVTLAHRLRISYMLLDELAYCYVQPHTNLDSVTIDTQDFTQADTTASYPWYKFSQANILKATVRQSILLASAFGIHMTMLELQDQANPSVMRFKLSALRKYLDNLNKTPEDEEQWSWSAATIVSCGLNSNLKPLILSSVVLSLGIGFINWCGTVIHPSDQLYTELAGSVIPPSTFIMMNCQSIFHRLVTWGLLHYDMIGPDTIFQFIPEELIQLPASSIDPSLIANSPVAHLHIHRNAATMLPPVPSKALSNQRLLEVYATTVTAITLLIALKHTGLDDTDATQFVLDAGNWLQELMNSSKGASQTLLMIGDLLQKPVYGLYQATLSFLLSVIISSLALVGAGSTHEVLIHKISAWCGDRYDETPFEIWFKAGSAAKRISTPCMPRDTTTPDGRRRLAFDILACMPAGDHMADNRASLQLFDALATISATPTGASQRLPILRVVGMSEQTISLEKAAAESDADSENEPFVMDPDQNVINAHWTSAIPAGSIIDCGHRRDSLQAAIAQSSVTYI